MDIQHPDSIDVTSEILLLLKDVDAELAEFRSLGDFSADIREQMRREFLPQRVSDTLNIEGVRVNPRITRAILEGQTLSEADRYSEQEVINAIRANDLVEEFAGAAELILPYRVRQLHSLVTDGLLEDPGGFRTRDVEITGADFRPPGPEQAPQLVETVCDIAESDTDAHPIVLACWLHATLGAIHPFMDGNGRTARLLQEWILLREDYLPVGIPASRRGEYYEALQLADGGNWMPLVGIVANSELTVLEKARRIAEAPKRRMERIKSLVRASRKTVRQQQYNQYEVWRRRTDGIRDEFQRWASDLSEESPEIAIRVKVWDPISFEKWREIKERGQARGTWLFNLNFIVNQRPVYAWLFYARRHEYAYTIEYEQEQHGLVGTFLTGDLEPNPQWDFGQFSDPYVSLRELLYVGEELYAYHEASVEQIEQAIASEHVNVNVGSRARWLAIRNVVLADVVERFLEECLLKLGLIEG